MKVSVTSVFVFILALIVEGCASTPNPKNLTSTSQISGQQSLLGFSVRPPEGQDWFYQILGSNWIEFTKQTKNKEKHTVIAMAGSMPVSEPEQTKRDFVGYVETFTKAEKSDSRFRSVNQEISALIIDRAECARVDFTAEDRGVPFAFGSTYFLQGFDILCLHPDFSYMLTRFGYSQRFVKGGEPLMLDDEINAYIKSISFDKEIKNRISIGPLLGVYAYDKFIFFPSGRNRSREGLLMNALKEGDCEYTEIYMPSPSSEQLLAIQYDGVWGASAYLKEPVPNLGCILGKVGRWNESLEAFRAVSTKSPHTANIWGNAGVAAHVIGKYKESAEYFRKAKSLEPDYFEAKAKQKKIFIASEKSTSVL